MSHKKVAPPLLNTAQAAFLVGPVSISLASRDGQGFPSITRGFGCRVSDDLGEVVVFLVRERAGPVLRDLEAGSPVAVVFSRPMTHQTLQLKGVSVRVRELARDERKIMLAAGEAFSAEIMALGHPPVFSRAIMAACSDKAVAVAFTPAMVFEQTPGPKAGMRLEPAP